MLAEYFLNNEKTKEQWKNILLQVGRKRKAENGTLGYQCTAVNMSNEKRVNLFIETSLIEDRDIKMIEKELVQAGCKVVD